MHSPVPSKYGHDGPGEAVEPDGEDAEAGVHVGHLVNVLWTHDDDVSVE